MFYIHTNLESNFTDSTRSETVFLLEQLLPVDIRYCTLDLLFMRVFREIFFL